MGRVPNFFIAGAAKSGTTSLYHYIRQHPDVFMSRVKEPHYFCSPDFPEVFRGPGDEGFNDNTMRSFEEYLDLFQDSGDARIFGEASVYYVVYPRAVERIKQFNKDAKSVLVLRNPVARAFSAYMHTVRDGRETLSFEEALDREDERIQADYQPLWWYKTVGLYAKQVQHFIDVMGKEQVKIFLYEDLKDANRVVEQLLGFLQLRNDVHIDTTIRHNQSGQVRSRKLYNFFSKPNTVKEVIKPFLPKDFRHKLGQKAKSMTLAQNKPSARAVSMLQSYFREDILNLQDVLHRDLSHWLV